MVKISHQHFSGCLIQVDCVNILTYTCISESTVGLVCFLLARSQTNG